VVQELRPGDPLFIGPYKLLGQLGSGGMGRVFLGLSAGGRRVAVKVIRPELAADPQFRARFRREVVAARKVSGLFTNVVVDADVDGPVPWLATAYVAGPSLAQAVSEHGPLPSGSVLALAAGLAESLAAIHAAGLVHRDLKPSNVLLAEDGPRVIDFGISRAVEATSLTNTGLVIGSPGFMSPEQAEGGVIGPPSDMFSLGAVLAFAATGEGPFGSGSTAALVFRVVYGAPGLDQVPVQVRPLIERCLAKDPGDRPAATEFLAQIGPVELVPGWLPEAVLGSIAPEQPPPRRAVSVPPVPDPVTDSQPTATPPGLDQTATTGVPARPLRSTALRLQPAPGARLRGRFWRWPVLAAAGAVLLVASAAIAFTLNGGGGRPRSSPTTSAPAGTSSGPALSTQSATPGRTPGIPYRFGLAGTSQYSCSEEGSVFSAASTSKVVFTFINNAGATLRIVWLNLNGTRQLYDVLSSGNSFSVDTYVGHYWLIANAGAQCLGIFDINGSGHVVITMS